MSTTRTRERDQALGTAISLGELPELSATDRVALRLGVALILRAQRHAELQERAEQARRTGVAGLAAAARTTAFERRHPAGPTW
ncbi:hypothetical protein [Amnibacterium kyonggiense]|uniref:Uncharacterized protein n=1 Tax=Amnibacterium kyonggiense TaxID=595671 RepID=A0A4R7FMK3_9MICO|nr:hypothetical protein [Amnibacterium kyonggiense]TDS77673.1 hypothetical protein CLV52_2632 [Amnibacterium kyonggiense]